jgi:hypothetical protein
MERSRTGAMRRETARVARIAMAPAATKAEAAPAATNGVSAGTIDTTMGAWVPYGLTGVTTLGEGFRCSKG